MPFEPSPHSRHPRPLGDPGSARRYLERALPGRWRFSYQMAQDLARQVEFLPWISRAEALDTYFLRNAEAMLKPKGLTELVNGAHDAGDGRASRLDQESAARFASWSRATLTAVLLELGESARVGCAAQALTFCLSHEPACARGAAVWLREHGREPLEAALRGLPGYALVLLAGSPSDTAGRFMARDAFWSAVLSAG